MAVGNIGVCIESIRVYRGLPEYVTPGEIGRCVDCGTSPCLARRESR